MEISDKAGRSAGTTTVASRRQVARVVTRVEEVVIPSHPFTVLIIICSTVMIVSTASRHVTRPLARVTLFLVAHIRTFSQRQTTHLTIIHS
jgi:hypothetical protein